MAKKFILAIAICDTINRNEFFASKPKDIRFTVIYDEVKEKQQIPSF